jgi:tetratricopeptide (TPR) repeat protein
MGRQVIRLRIPRGLGVARGLAAYPLAGLACLILAACIEKPDPASQALAILHKRPSSFLDRVVSLDALASRELGLEPAPILAESLHAYATRLRPLLSVASTEAARAEVLRAFVFDSLAIVPLLEDPGLAASLPSRVLIDRRGSCVGLVLLHLALAEQLDLPLAPLFLPGHLALRWGTGPEAFNVETLRRGLVRSDSFYRETFALGKRPWYVLAPAPPDRALGALVFNLANHHRARGEAAWALEEYRLAATLVPGWPEAQGNLGGSHLDVGAHDSARIYLAASLAGDSLAGPAWRNLEILHRARGDSAGAADIARQAPKGATGDSASAAPVTP